MAQEFPDYPIVGHREQSFSVDLNDENPAVLADIRPKQRTWVKVQIVNGAVALDQFKISGRATKAANFVTLYETSTDYTTLAGRLQGSSGDLTILGAGQEGWVWVHVKGLETLRIEVARAAGANTTVAAEVGAD